VSATITQIAAHCRVLKLPTIAREVERLAEQAQRQGLAPLDLLDALFTAEIEERHQRRAVRRMREAKFPRVKTLEGFDFRRNPTLPEAHLRGLSEGGYIDRAETVLFVGDPGTGKTHLATALGVAAAAQGRQVRFITAGRLVNELTEARDVLQLSQRVNRYARPELLILDELGYLPLSKTDAELLFQVLSERTERRALVVTTNLPFSDWTQVFPDARLCRAVVDRLTHRCHIIDTGKKSIRLEEALRRTAGDASRVGAGGSV